MKKAAFTMIELIFVIVILGILASVALPKLLATRDDAKNARIRANVSVCLSDAIGAYTATRTTPSSAVSPSCSHGNLNNSAMDISTSGDDIIVKGDLLGTPSTFTLSGLYKGTQVSF